MTGNTILSMQSAKITAILVLEIKIILNVILKVPFSKTAVSPVSSSVSTWFKHTRAQLKYMEGDRQGGENMPSSIKAI